MTYEKFEELFEETESKWDGDNAFQGLQIIAKYIKDKDILCGADHDIIYSVDVNELIEAEISEEDVIQLRKFNWMIEGGYLACFV